MTRPRLQQVQPYDIGAFLLVVASVLLYLPASNFSLISLEDNVFVDSPLVLKGLAWENIVRAFITVQENYWIPVTWISFMSDVSIFGHVVRGFHVTNIILHCANVLLLYLLLRTMTGRPGPSLLATSFFALHPLRVESVAWITERKDVLSSLFFLLAMLTYGKYARERSRGSYLLVAAFFVLGMMSKPMLVTLPILLLLCDFWPLRRLIISPGAIRFNALLRSNRAIMVEKVPLFILSLAFSALTFYTQRDSLHPIGGPEGLGRRVGAAAFSYLIYLRKLFWPSDLAIEGFDRICGITALQSVLAVSTLLLMTAIAVFWWRKKPYLTWGCLWYLAALLPVSGLIATGAQWITDRFTYLPQIGVIVAMVWAGSDIVGKNRARRWSAMALTAVLLATMCVLTRTQLTYWRDGVSLFTRSLELNPSSTYSRLQMGIALSFAGRDLEAIEYFDSLLGYSSAGNDIGTMPGPSGKTGSGFGEMENTAPGNNDYHPYDESIHSRLGVALGRAGQLEKALPYLRFALDKNPDMKDIHFNLANVLFGLGERQGAKQHYQEAIKDDPFDYQAHHNLGCLFMEAGDAGGALKHFTKTLKIVGNTSPHAGKTHYMAARASSSLGLYDEAIEHYRFAATLLPDDIRIRLDYADLLIALDQTDEGLVQMEAIRKLEPGSAEAVYVAGRIDEAKGDIDKALQSYRQALGMTAVLPGTHDAVRQAIAAIP